MYFNAEGAVLMLRVHLIGLSFDDPGGQRNHIQHMLLMIRSGGNHNELVARDFWPVREITLVWSTSSSTSNERDTCNSRTNKPIYCNSELF